MKKRTVLFVYHALQVGGVEKELLAYIKHLSRAEYSLHLALTDISGEVLSELPPYVQIHNIRGNSVKPDVRYLVNLFFLIVRIRPHVVVGFMQDICFNILLVRTCSPIRFRVIISEHIVLSRWQQVLHTPWIKTRIVPMLYKQATIIAAHGESVFKDLATCFHIDESKIILIPNYIDPHRYRYCKKGSSARQNNAPLFLYIGRFEPEKNIDFLLHAFQTAHKKLPTIRLLLIGVGRDKPYRQLAEMLGIEKSMEILPPSLFPERYYKSASALVIPSLVEGRSRVMIEAMLSGCPVISSDFTGHDRYISHNSTGLVFHLQSRSDLSNLIIYAARHPARMNILARNAYKYISKMYSGAFEKRYTHMINRLFTESLIR